MIGELPDSKGYNAVLMVVDCLSKQIHTIPTVTSLDSAGVAQLFLEHVWCHHGLPEEVIRIRLKERLSCVKPVLPMTRQEL